MSEDEAKAWVAARFGAAAIDGLARFASLLAAANERQNLVAPSSLAEVWGRHLVDSAQLALLDDQPGLWLDVGSGGGLPGLVLALLLDRSFVLCEPRRLRAEFLREAVAALGLGARVSIAQVRVETLRINADTISARAVAPMRTLFGTARHCATPATNWVMPRGKSGRSELDTVNRAVRGEFHVKQSLTDPQAVIVVARGIGAQ